jgi:L-asparaginase
MSEQISPRGAKQLVVLGTGGTIAGTAASASDHTGYTAAQIGVATLLQSVPGLQDALQGCELLSEQVAQLDSKDMDFSTMLRLAQRCAHYLAQPQTSGIVITHGTDTLEETAYFLHRVIPSELQHQPIVLTCAMRPATSSEADGPRNLRDAVCLALDAQAQGVLAVCAGDVHHALLVQKIHTYALNAFSSGDTALGEPGRMAQVVQEQGLLQTRWEAGADQIFMKNRPLDHMGIAQGAIELIALEDIESIQWPRVEIVSNHSHATGSIVRALLASSRADDPLRGIVVAGTGNGTVSQALQTALDEAQARQVEVVISSRCAWGGVISTKGASCISTLPANKARIEWMLSACAREFRPTPPE